MMTGLEMIFLANGVDSPIIISITVKFHFIMIVIGGIHSLDMGCWRG